MNEKTCTKCNETKPLEEFSNKGKGNNNFAAADTAYWDTKKNTCKSCDAAYAREFRKRNPGYRGSGKNTKYEGEDKKLISAIRLRLNVCKQNFRKRRGGDHGNDLDADYLFDLFKAQKGLCVYSGIPMRVEKKHLATLSIDKIDPDKGYTKGNVQWVTWAVNRAKGEMPEADFIRMCRMIAGRCNDYPERE